jgi:hypothetical protein
MVNVLLGLLATTIMMVGVLLPSVEALEQSLIDFIATKKDEASQVCEVESVRMKISLISCITAKNEEIDGNFKNALDLLEGVKALLPESTETPTPTPTPET